MRQRKHGAEQRNPPPSAGNQGKESSGKKSASAGQSPYVGLVLLVLLMHGSWMVYRVQYGNLPKPLSPEQAGKKGFSEITAMEHVQALTSFGPHPVGSDALDSAVQYVFSAAKYIKENAHWEVNIEVDHFHSAPGINRLSGGVFMGKTLVYSGLEHVVVRATPKYSPEAKSNAILLSSHIDTVFSTEGAGDCSSCVAVMLELARCISQWAHGFNHAVIFLFNTGEEEGLNGAHSFITQHPWNDTVRFIVDIEAMGIGGKSSVFQSGPDSWGIEHFAHAAKYPSAQILAQDLFHSGVIKSATDYQVYKEVAGLSGLDFAYADHGAVYHTKNDKMKLLKAGSLQHLGENMLSFLLESATDTHLPKSNSQDVKLDNKRTVFFDILGSNMVLYRQSFGSLFNNSAIVQALLLLMASLVMGGSSAVKSFFLSCLATSLMWLFSFGSTLAIAFIIPIVCSSPVPYIAHPWLVIGLLGAPALLGALAGQRVGFTILQNYLHCIYPLRHPNLSDRDRVDIVKWEAQRWLYKGGFFQWLIILILHNWYNSGSSYLAVVWLVSPAFAYGLMEATLSPRRLPRQLKVVTLVLGMVAPIMISAGISIRLLSTLIGMMARFGRDPGGSPDWIGSILIGACVATIVCLSFVYFLSFIQSSGGKKIVVIACIIVFIISLAAVVSNALPPFSDDAARALHVVHVIDVTENPAGKSIPLSYVSLSSVTPGKLKNEVDQMKDEGFVCGRNKIIDFVTFSVHYGCLTYDDAMDGWNSSDIPALQVESDSKEDARVTLVNIDTKAAKRWFLAINTKAIQSFDLDGVSVDTPGLSSDKNGWHIIQYSGGKGSPSRFLLTLHWHKNSTGWLASGDVEPERPLLKLRTDLNVVTPKVERVLSKLPSWCSLFGKSTGPFTLSFLTQLKVNY